MILLTMIQLVGNQFGFDRSGFRVYVLCAAPRRDILLGKNLAVAPLALGFSLVFVLACWFGLWRQWGFLVSLGVAAAVWLVIVLIPALKR